MTDERKQQIKDMRTLYANMGKEERAKLAKEFIITNLDSHVLSTMNTIMLYLQSQAGEFGCPTVVAGYQQWKRAGKQVKRGEHGMTIWFPVGTKDEDNNVVAVERYFITTVFDISQIQPIEVKQPINEGLIPVAV